MTGFVGEEPGSFVNPSVFDEYTRMDTEYYLLVPIAWQLQVQAYIYFITLVYINVGETIVPEVLGNLADKCLIRLKAVELVNNGCLKGVT